METYNKITCHARSRYMIRKMEKSEHLTFFLLFGFLLNEGYSSFLIFPIKFTEIFFLLLF